MPPTFCFLILTRTVGFGTKPRFGLVQLPNHHFRCSSLNLGAMNSLARALVRGAVLAAPCRPATALMGANAMQGSALEAQLDASVQAARKALLVTMTFPTDRIPLELIVPHQLRMLTRADNSSVDLVIVDNRPSGDVATPQEAYLDQLRRQGNDGQRVVRVDYDRGLDDPAFLARFYKFPEAEDPEGMTVRKLTSSFTIHEQTNLVGMLTALAQCLDAEPTVEVCMYIDPDIFVYRSPGGRGLFDLAPGVFDKNPQLQLLLPPLLCERTHVAVDADGVCEQGPPLFELSQRHLLFHRSRLVAALPFMNTFDMLHGRFDGLFEKILTRQMFDSHGCGSMMCGSETVVTHPSVRGNDGFVGATEHFEELAKFGADKTGISGFDATYTVGLQVFLDRWEAGEFKTERSVQEFSGNGQYTSSCLAMRPSIERIDEGLAY